MSPIIYADAQMLDEVKKMESYYIYKPVKKIRDVIFRMIFIDFALCTFFSFHILWIPMIPVWIMVIYRQYIRIVYLAKYNVSYIRMIILTIVVLLLEFVVSYYFREILWEIIKSIRS